MKKELINPDYIRGLIDGEGSFNITISKDIKRSNKHRIICEMHITQNKNSENVLKEIKEYLKCGTVKIDNKKTNTMKYQISSIKDIKEVIIPILEEYPLLTSKYLNYKAWKEAVEMMNNKEHLKIEGIRKIKGIKEKMNKKRENQEKYEFLKEHLSKPENKINAEWIIGFVDGEGCFYFYIGKETKRTIQLQASLEITQNKHDIKILEKIKEYLECGRLKPKDILKEKELKGIGKLIISNPTDIERKIRPIFDKYTLRTEKEKDYKDWKILIDMKKEKMHLTLEGLKKMKEIKERMNRGRNKI